jgi:hypothetical protein
MDNPFKVNRLSPPDLFISDDCTGHTPTVGSDPHWTWRTRITGNDHSVSCVDLDGQYPGQPNLPVTRWVERYTGGLKSATLQSQPTSRSYGLLATYTNY